MTTLHLTAATFIERDPDSVFRELHDPATLLGCVPGATLTSLTGPRAFKARIAMGLGPIKPEYQGRGRIVASDPRTRTASLEVTGEPAANLATVRVRMSMTVSEQDGGSEVRMSFKVGMSDRTWLLASGLLDPIACDLLDRTTRRMKQQLERAHVAPLPPAA
jgi:uncharacterized protein